MASGVIATPASPSAAERESGLRVITGTAVLSKVRPRTFRPVVAVAVGLTLSIHSIRTARREQFYWLTVLATFALGTAVGDLTGITLRWGFLASGLLFTVAILVPLVLWRLGANAMAASVLTRPLGDSFADWLGKEPAIGGGRGYGDGPVTLAALVLIVTLVAYAARSRHDVQPPAAHPLSTASSLS